NYFDYFLYFIISLFLFFFSSRRRHTRFSRDWSSDVCSSDLEMAAEAGLVSIHFVNAASSLLVAPFGGVDRRLSTAPYAIGVPRPDRKSTRLNSSHVKISYAVFCLKKKKKQEDAKCNNQAHRP